MLDPTTTGGGLGWLGMVLSSVLDGLPNLPYAISGTIYDIDYVHFPKNKIILRNIYIYIF